jgi:2-aminoadipate transaminase
MTSTPIFAYMSQLREGLPKPAPVAGNPLYNFGTGHNDPDLIPVDGLARAIQQALSVCGRDLAKYMMGGSALGIESLRKLVAKMLFERRGISVAPDQVLITGGSAQGIDLVNQILVSRGDTVIYEQYTYSGAFSKLARAGARCVGAPLDEDGVIPESLDRLLWDLKARRIAPRYLYIIPTVQNPTGTVMSLERRHQLLAVTREHGLPILEDDCYADVSWAGALPPALFALDPTQVIYIGSFSKSLAPALRVGYAVAQPGLVSQLLACKNDGGTGAVDQLTVLQYMDGRFDTHLREVSRRLEAKAVAMIEAFARHFGAHARIRKPAGGIYVWVELLANHIDTRNLVEPAKAAGITFNPGAEWACDPESAKHFMRLCFAMPSLEEIETGVAELAKIYRSHLSEIASDGRAGASRKIST